eukprot:GHRQ01013966.1.p1 GENE.GHRQ01013966.1~~GHRQ01013966.1.p1  ORF type:complete len:273 (+),score=103.32 GHRQ01013966.1:1003-1821(+)
MTEVCKVIFAITVLLCLGTGRPGPPMYRSVRSFIADARHNWLLALPAGLYAINNYLKFAMQLYFRPTTTKMLGNLKIFTIAILMRTVMHRRFSVIQYEALFLLVAGITINQLQSCGNKGEQIPGGSLLPAVLCVLGSVTVPSAASVYNEKGLKKHMDTSVHLQNFFLYFYGMCFNLLGALGVCLYQQRSFGSIFEHQTRVTLILVVNNALQVGARLAWLLSGPVGGAWWVGLMQQWAGTALMCMLVLCALQILQLRAASAYSRSSFLRDRPS